MPINPITGYFALGAALTGFAAGWMVNGWRNDAAIADGLKQAEKARIESAQAIEAQSAIYENMLADLNQREVETKIEVRKVYRNVEVPGDCALRPAAAQLLEDARSSANAAATGQSLSAMPTD